MNQETTSKRSSRNFEAEQLERIAEILKTISNPLRLEIVGMLEKSEPLTVTEFVEQLKVEQSLISHHLAKMKDKGVLKSNRVGKNIYYSLASHHILRIFDCMEDCDLI